MSATCGKAGCAWRHDQVDALEQAWGIIANASDWDLPGREEWREAAEHFRDATYFQNDRNDVGRLAEEIHAEHHPGTFVPSLDSCAEHTRAEYEELIRTLRQRAPDAT